MADCWNGSNEGNPGNGQARTTGECSMRGVRGGAWGFYPQGLRFADRGKIRADDRDSNQGFRLRRTIIP
jgi:formylglycine-generating enzyme required for sulfatase activity